jgi:hypothetical protein
MNYSPLQHSGHTSGIFTFEEHFLCQTRRHFLQLKYPHEQIFLQIKQVLEESVSGAHLKQYL